MAFFDQRGGLLAANLTNAVIDMVPCGYDSLQQKVFVYAGGVWQPNDRKRMVQKAVAELTGNKYRTSHVTLVLEMLSHPGKATPITCKPVSRYINVRNGLLDWKAGVLRQHSPKCRSTVQLPVRYDSEAKCPKIDTFLSEVLPKDCIEFIWEVIGYTLYSGNPLQIALLLHGKGSNGKGTFIRLLKALLGEANCSSVTLKALTTNRFRAASLYGKLANIAGDIDAGWIDDTAEFKAMTGGDVVDAEHKFGQPFQFTSWAVPIYSANELFRSKDTTEGFLRRWVVIPFPNQFVGKAKRIESELDRELQEKGELEGMLAHATRSLVTLMERGHFVVPQSVRDAKGAFIAKSDSVREWVADVCVLDPNAFSGSRTDLHLEYERAMVADGQSKPLSAIKFYERINRISGVTEHKRNGVRGYKGIRLKSPDERSQGSHGAGSGQEPGHPRVHKA